VQDLYEKGLRQIDKLEETKQKLQIDAWNLRGQPNQTWLNQHISAYQLTVGAFNRLLGRLRGLRGGAQAACELAVAGDEAVNFNPAATLSGRVDIGGEGGGEGGGNSEDGGGEGLGLGSGGERELVE
jgi:hypothetical protein